MDLSGVLRYINGKIITMLFIVVFHGYIYAQQDTEFWFVAPEVSASHGDSPIKMIFSTQDLPAEVTISQPANPAFAPISINIAPNATFSQDLTSRKSQIENNPADQVNLYGIFVQSDNPVTAYYEVASSVNPDIYPLKGRNAIGIDFMVPSQDDFKNQVGYERIDIVATTNGTEIFITPTTAIQGHAADIQYMIELDKGETYCLRATSQLPSVSLKGTEITSTKPICVTISDDSVRPTSNSGYDLIGDQLVPTHILANEYIVVKGFADALNEKVYILAVVDGTEIYLDGNPGAVATLNRGEQYKFQLATDSKYITSNEPVYVYHLSGHSDEVGSALLPPIACTGSRTISFVRTSTGQFSMMLFTEAANIANFEVNGNVNIIQSGDFAPVTGTANAWMFARIDNPAVSTGANTITNSSGKFHLGILNQLGGSSEYGFFSAYNSLNLGDDVLICSGDDYTFDAGDDMDSYLWSNDSTTQSITVSDTGDYWVQVIDDMCNLSDTIHLGFFIDPIADLGADVTVCPETPVMFDPGSFRETIWFDGSADPTFTTDIPQMIWVRVVDANGCSDMDTVYLMNYPKPAPITIYHD